MSTQESTTVEKVSEPSKKRVRKPSVTNKSEFIPALAKFGAHWVVRYLTGNTIPPKELSGIYTSKKDAETAIIRYMQSKVPVIVKRVAHGRSQKD